MYNLLRVLVEMKGVFKKNGLASCPIGPLEFFYHWPVINGDQLSFFALDPKERRSGEHQLTISLSEIGLNEGEFDDMRLQARKMASMGAVHPAALATSPNITVHHRRKGRVKLYSLWSELPETWAEFEARSNRPLNSLAFDEEEQRLARKPSFYAAIGNRLLYFCQCNVAYGNGDVITTYVPCVVGEGPKFFESAPGWIYAYRDSGRLEIAA